MNAGRELDAVIAEKVMGCTAYRTYGPDGEPREYSCGCKPEFPHNENVDGLNVVKRYSTHIAAAWEVVEKIRGLHAFGQFSVAWDSELADDERGQPKKTYGWRCGWVFDRSWNLDGFAHEPAHAICLAALQAVSQKPAR